MKTANEPVKSAMTAMMACKYILLTLTLCAGWVAVVYALRSTAPPDVPASVAVAPSAEPPFSAEEWLTLTDEEKARQRQLLPSVAVAPKPPFWPRNG